MSETMWARTQHSNTFKVLKKKMSTGILYRWKSISRTKIDFFRCTKLKDALPVFQEIQWFWKTCFIITSYVFQKLQLLFLEQMFYLQTLLVRDSYPFVLTPNTIIPFVLAPKGLRLRSCDPQIENHCLNI